MTEPSKTEQENDENHELSFGERLCVERKKQNLSIADVATAIHLSEKVVDAIERSDMEQLPQLTFVQGYLRAYAKYLDISDALVLEEYARAVPHQQEAGLQPLSKLPDEASSNSPFVKMITILLLVLMVAAALYASFGYYKNAIVADDTELHDQALLSLPEAESLEQGSVEYDALPESYEQPEIEPNIEEQEPVINADTNASELPTNIVEERAANAVLLDDAANQKQINQLIAKGDDNLELSATQVSWVEVGDANGVNLYYDLLQEGQRIILKGTAPFKIFLGNAP